MRRRVVHLGITWPPKPDVLAACMLEAKCLRSERFLVKLF
jgi:hypothetical protein